MREGCGMEEPVFWDLFLDTGDPVVYLLFRSWADRA